MKSSRPVLILEDAIVCLKKIRQEKNISHDALATKVGISRPAISHIENGKRRPTLLMMLKLTQGLDIPLSALLQAAEKKYPS